MDVRDELSDAKEIIKMTAPLTEKIQMPEEIWAQHPDGKCGVYSTVDIIPPLTKYIRADIAALPEPMTEGDIQSNITDVLMKNCDHEDIRDISKAVIRALKDAGVLLVKDEERVG